MCGTVSNHNIHKFNSTVLNGGDFYSTCGNKVCLFMEISERLTHTVIYVRINSKVPSSSTTRATGNDMRVTDHWVFI